MQANIDLRPGQHIKMKVLTVIKASSLALLCGNVFAVTSPVVTNDVGSTITGKSAYAVAPCKIHVPYGKPS